MKKLDLEQEEKLNKSTALAFKFGDQLLELGWDDFYKREIVLKIIKLLSQYKKGLKTIKPPKNYPTAYDK